MITIWVTIGWALTAVAAVVLALALARKSAAERRERVVPASDLGREQESPGAVYRPMENLLSGDELKQLERLPGYQPEIGERFAKMRKRIFRLYLRELKQDFYSLHAEARRAAATAGPEHAEVVGVLLRQKLAFHRAVLALEMRLAMAEMGFGSVEVAPLVDAIEAMRLNLARLAPQGGLMNQPANA